MAAKSSGKKQFGYSCRTIDLSASVNWPRRVPRDEWWQNLAAGVRDYPTGRQEPWGIPFQMAEGRGPRAILVAAAASARGGSVGGGSPEITVPVKGKASHLCVLHDWRQLPDTVDAENPQEGLVVGEYILTYSDGSDCALPVRSRFEVNMTESPGPAWLAVGFDMPETIDPTLPPGDREWGHSQTGVVRRTSRGKTPTRGAAPASLVCAIANPHPDRTLTAVTIVGRQQSPLIVAGISLYSGSDNPLRHLPRRTYRVRVPGGRTAVAETAVDMGVVTRVERVTTTRGRRWLEAATAGTNTSDADQAPEDLLEIVGSPDSTVSVRLPERKGKLEFSLGQAYQEGESKAADAGLQVLGGTRQWMRVTVIDETTGKPTPVRAHFSGSRGEYLAPYGHHSQVNANWFEDYGADLQVGGRNYAYVPGEFTTDLPVGDVYVELYKGFEYVPVRRKVTVRSGQKELRLGMKRWCDLRKEGWVTADTHVHFLSPHTAHLEGQAEGVNVVNLLASQWGRLFTNVGDVTGDVNVGGDDTLVYVGTENRNHMLGHMSMLGTKGTPVSPMCCGGPGEAHIGDPDFRMLAEWALENKRKGGVVIRPHYPFCGFTEDPVPILKGLVDALEIRDLRGSDFPTQEWYRYLNCGYRVAVCGGTDKMGAYSALGWMRTYAKLAPGKPLTYENWAKAVRAGRTVSTTGPLMDLVVEGLAIGDTLRVPKGGAELEVHAAAECFWPLQQLEIVVNGRVVGARRAAKGSRKLQIQKKIRLQGSGWIAARCAGVDGHPAGYMAAHTSPVYVQSGRERLFDAQAAQHMLALVEGGVEYLNKLATVFDEASRKRMVKLFNEARQELGGRLVVEASHHVHHGSAGYHRHWPGDTDHEH